MYRTKPKLFAFLGRMTFAVGVIGVCGGIILAFIQPQILDTMHNGDNTVPSVQVALWEKFVDSVKSQNFVPITLVGLPLTGVTVMAAYGILNPGKIAWHWILLILLSMISWSLFYTFIGTAFNMISIGVYGITLVYLCRPRVKAYFCYLKDAKQLQ